MAHGNLPRRSIITYAATGMAFAATTNNATAQQVEVTLKDFPVLAAGRTHGLRIRETQKELKGNTPMSRDGLLILVDVLVGLKVLAKDDAEILKKLVRILYESPALQQVLVEVQRTLTTFNAQTNALLTTLVDLIRDSIETAKQLLVGVDWKVVLPAISADMAGALTGAGTGAQIGGKPGAIIGALIGGASASINSVLAVRK